VPAGVVDVVATVSVAGVPGGTELGLTEQVAFAGQPEAIDKATLLEKPFNAATLIEEVGDWPALTVAEVGFVDTEKSGDAVPHPLNLKEPIRVLQLNAPDDCRYSFMYQKVQSSDGSMRKEL
jgi:hypothetical protein